jgi:hemolysin activation/secretion protein
MEFSQDASKAVSIPLQERREIVSILCCVCVALWFGVASANAANGVSPGEEAASSGARTNDNSRFVVQAFRLSGISLGNTDELSEKLSRYTGMNVGEADLVKAASDLQLGLEKRGFTNAIVSIATNQITNGIVVLNVFRGLSPQILISGRRYTSTGAEVGPRLQAGAGEIKTTPTNAAPAAAANTNQGPTFVVRAYGIEGDTLLTTDVLASIFQKYTGTNIGVADIIKASSELQMEYRTRGFLTVNVAVPAQQITNEMVYVRVFVGRISEINVVGNRFFSSNNVMRALPSLRTNIILNDKIFQAELDRANANRDRQIYPQIEPGGELNQTALQLKVTDQLPLHAKVEFNNQNSPGTPELRVNSSAVYNNLWQHEHSVGVQYSFSPEVYKFGDEWNFYDRPLVANYSGFYRLPLGAPSSVEQSIAANSGSFGYDEATRKFRLPPPSGGAELNIYGSRSTIDTGVEATGNKVIFDVPGVRKVTESDSQQDITINEGVGFRLNGSLSQVTRWHSAWSLGADYKSYELTSHKTNSFQFTEVHLLQDGTPVSIVSEVHSAVPLTHNSIDYLPFALRYDGSMQDSLGSTAVGLGLSINTWYSGSRSNLHTIAGSTRSAGNWVILTPSFARDFIVYTNWVLTARADGQWASEPLISNERFGAGGVNSVRGYHEGEVFGDTGWHVTLEQKTPGHIVGLVYDKTPLMLRGIVYSDYAETYLLDPHGAKGRERLWDVGAGGVISVGPHWEARFLFSLPLLDAGSIEAMQPRFNFSLLGQF